MYSSTRPRSNARVAQLVRLWRRAEAGWLRTTLMHVSTVYRGVRRREATRSDVKRRNATGSEAHWAHLSHSQTDYHQSVYCPNPKISTQLHGRFGTSTGQCPATSWANDGSTSVVDADMGSEQTSVKCCVLSWSLGSSDTSASSRVHHHVPTRTCK
jgi:hypothetical protein